jgi:hypothetical protein
MTKITAYKATRSDSRFYNNSRWDLVEAFQKDKDILGKIDMKTLADSLKKKNRQELNQILMSKAAARKALQNQIAGLDIQKDNFIAAEKTKTAAAQTQTLESAIEIIIKEQVKRFNMKIE